MNIIIYEGTPRGTWKEYDRVSDVLPDRADRLVHELELRYNRPFMYSPILG